MNIFGIFIHEYMHLKIQYNGQLPLAGPIAAYTCICMHMHHHQLYIPMYMHNVMLHLLILIYTCSYIHVHCTHARIHACTYSCILSWKGRPASIVYVLCLCVCLHVCVCEVLIGTVSEGK